jgi:hypothetical protein
MEMKTSYHNAYLNIFIFNLLRKYLTPMEKRGSLTPHNIGTRVLNYKSIILFLLPLHKRENIVYLYNFQKENQIILYVMQVQK